MADSIPLFSYPWHELFSPLWLIGLIAISYSYYKFFIVSPYYHVTGLRKKCFYTAIGLLFLIKGSPFKVIASNYLFSAHVFEIAILLFAVIPFVILSIPTEFYRQYFWHYRMRHLISLFSHPWLAALVFNGVLTAYLVPRFFNIIQQSVLLTLGSHFILILTAILMWSSIINPIPGVNHFYYFGRVAFVFLNAVLLLPIGFFLLLTMNHTYYPMFEAVAGQLIPSLTAVYDQQLGGGVLKSIQLLSYGTALFYLISHWAAEEEDKENEDENVRVVQGIVIPFPHKK